MVGVFKINFKNCAKNPKLHENFLYSVNTMSTVTSGQTQYKRAVEGGKNSTNTWGNLQNNFFPQSHIIVIRFL